MPNIKKESSVVSTINCLSPVTLNFLPAHLAGGVSGSHQCRDAETQPACWQEVQHDAASIVRWHVTSITPLNYVICFTRSGYYDRVFYTEICLWVIDLKWLINLVPETEEFVDAANWFTIFVFCSYGAVTEVESNVVAISHLLKFLPDTNNSENKKWQIIHKT